MYTLPQNKQGNMTAGPILQHRSRIKKNIFLSKRLQISAL